MTEPGEDRQVSHHAASKASRPTTPILMKAVPASVDAAASIPADWQARSAANPCPPTPSNGLPTPNTRDGRASPLERIRRGRWRREIRKQQAPQLNAWGHPDRGYW